MITLSPVKRRLVYVIIFEILAISLSTLLLILVSNGDAAQSLPVSIIVFVTAVVWNFIYNTFFERVERRWQVKVRTLKVRSIHAMGFEGGLLLICLLLYIVWYDVGL